MAVPRDEEWSGVGRLSFLTVLLITASVVAAATAPVGHRLEVARILLAGPWAGWSWPRVSMSFGVFTVANTVLLLAWVFAPTRVTRAFLVVGVLAWWSIAGSFVGIHFGI